MCICSKSLIILKYHIELTRVCAWNILFINPWKRFQISCPKTMHTHYALWTMFQIATKTSLGWRHPFTAVINELNYVPSGTHNTPTLKRGTPILDGFVSQRNGVSSTNRLSTITFILKSYLCSAMRISFLQYKGLRRPVIKAHRFHDGRDKMMRHRPCERLHTRSMWKGLTKNHTTPFLTKNCSKWV